jgi:hypothetical protein
VEIQELLFSTGEFSCRTPNGLFKRTKRLLFAVFRPADAYLVHLGDHDTWDVDDLLTIIVRNWPDRGIVEELRGILPARPGRSTAERIAMEKIGVVTPFTFEGRVYVPAVFPAADGTAMGITKSADEPNGQD